MALDRADPETYLRLACERLLLSGNRQPHQGGEVAAIGRACIAAQMLGEERVAAVLDEYGLASSLRDNGGRLGLRSLVAGTQSRTKLSARRVVVGELDLGTDRRMTLERVIFAEDATHLELSGVGTPRRAPAPGTTGRPSSGAAHLHSGPVQGLTIVVRDDQGTTASATPGRSSWSDRSWGATFTTDVPLGAATAWLEIGGARVDLPARGKAPEVRVEPVATPDPVRAMLYREVVGSLSRHGDGQLLDAVIEALVATGAVAREDPVVDELHRITTAVNERRSAPGLPEPWAALTRRLSRSDGPVGQLPIGSAIEDIAGCSIRFDALSSSESSFSVALAVSPGLPLLHHFPGLRLEQSPIDW